MTRIKKLDPYRTTYHRDGTVTYWCVHGQVWRRSAVLSADTLASFSREERERVLRHIRRASTR